MCHFYWFWGMDEGFSQNVFLLKTPIRFVPQMSLYFNYMTDSSHYFHSGSQSPADAIGGMEGSVCLLSALGCP